MSIIGRLPPMRARNMAAISSSLIDSVHYEGRYRPDQPMQTGARYASLPRPRLNA
jgi:hypothetical protein